jgi:hypothetical protein
MKVPPKYQQFFTVLSWCNTKKIPISWTHEIQISEVTNLRVW